MLIEIISVDTFLLVRHYRKHWDQAKEMLVDLKQGLRKMKKNNTRDIQSMDVSTHAAPPDNVAPHHLQYPRIKGEGDAGADNRVFEKMAWIAYVTIHCLLVYQVREAAVALL